MDCNKEEASRAKMLAENMMQSGDFDKAQKLVMKAERLFSGLDSLPQISAVCDVHCSADKRINGLENWYGILQVMRFSDDATIKKQYKKLALLLHPDKNQFPGAEAAFKLVGEAIRLLTDKEKRTQYDIKLRICSRVAFNANSGLQCGVASNATDSVVKSSTFWTCCEYCGCRYKYLGQYVNSKMYCSSCQRSFMAYDTGLNGVPPKPNIGQKEVQNQGSCNAPVNKNVESTGVQPGSVAAEVDKESAKENFSKSGGGEKNDAGSSIAEEGEGKMNNTAELPKAEVTEPGEGASKYVPDESVSRSSQAPSMNKDKRKRRKIVEEPTEDKADSKNNNKRRKIVKKPTEDKANSNDSNRRTSQRKSQEVSCGKKGRKRSGGSSAPSCLANGKANKRVDSGYQQSSSMDDKKSEGCETRGEGMGVTGKIDDNHKPITQDSPDPDFHNFELKTSCFAVNQVWSLYDSSDGMPRFYARIRKVIDDAEFKLCITWLDPLHVNNDNSIPIACGVFQDGESQEVDDLMIFSCQMLPLPGDNDIVIYPRKGEVWAVFRGWESSWSASSENYKGTCEYDYVEVLCDFSDVDGLGVAYLGKVEGFVSLFHRDVKYGVLQLQVPPNEMLRFSHRVPSFKLTGREREGVPPGCFELDTAALSDDMFEVAYSKVYTGLDGERPNGKTGAPISEASKVEVQAHSMVESSLSLKKHQKLSDNSSFKASERMCSNHEINSVKKSRKSVKAVNGLKLRKSPRRLSETNNQAALRPCQEKAEKKSANDGASCIQPDEFSSSDEMMTTQKKPTKVTAVDSSRIKETDRDVDKPTGNSKKRGRNDESLSQSRGNGLLTRLNGSVKSSAPETHGPSSCKTRQENTYNFENQRSVDKFQIDQVWAIYSNDQGMPRKYVQIKRIDTSPGFKLHVATLELYRPPNLMTHPVCCGCFKLKTGRAAVLEPHSFSHQVKAVKSGINRYEVYPRKGEIWALYKHWNTTDCAETEELEIVEVVETKEQGIQVVLLTAKVSNKLLYGRCMESMTRFVDIPKTEVNRFSHQIPAFRHERSATGDYVWWELDSRALTDL